LSLSSDVDILDTQRTVLCCDRDYRVWDGAFCCNWGNKCRYGQVRRLGLDSYTSLINNFLRINEPLQKSGTYIKKGDEIGLFQFGGSSIIVAFEKDRIRFDDDILSVSRRRIMMDVEVGMSLGTAVPRSWALCCLQFNYAAWSRAEFGNPSNLYRLSKGRPGRNGSSPASLPMLYCSVSEKYQEYYRSGWHLLLLKQGRRRWHSLMPSMINDIRRMNTLVALSKWLSPCCSN
jgi:hypothetical protein